MPDIKKIVLTGGPCAGKTTALVKITEYFSGFGYKVFNVPEVPTIYSTAGWNYLTPNRDLYYQGERAIMETQLALENQFMRLAEVCEKPVLIVCDRGAMDISAYIKPEEWDEITRMAGTNSEALRQSYDAVLHLVSAADGAEQYYTTATNATRYEQANEEGLRVAREAEPRAHRDIEGGRSATAGTAGAYLPRRADRRDSRVLREHDNPDLSGHGAWQRGSSASP